MLEVRHLCKTYKSKDVVTKALDDVSLVFPEKGMVFILGKSGSGKSTLLNLCGGLDTADSGEIIIRGRSSKDFSTQDFDSYRNTLVGFVFQEYNVLEEFSVEDNIALALELQNKKRDKEAIQKILDVVEMSELASRKPTTLSGGQKQRLAIARALVKQPQIIMADEPTGALDSKTGKQVFDTLKKLSEEKLVLVISHDRDFAEQYADRIIEIKDGKVVSDMVRTESEDKANVKFYGKDTVCIQNGAEISDQDMENIREFLKNADGSAVICTSQKGISAVKEEVPQLEAGEFEELKQQPQSNVSGDQTFIRSHLPLRHAVKMGAGSLKTKPVRLVFTLLLSIVAFVMFGLSSTGMFYNERSVMETSLMSSDYNYLRLGKQYYVRNKQFEGDELIYEYESISTTSFTTDELAKFRAEYDRVLAVVSVNSWYHNVEISQQGNVYYGYSPDGFVIADSSMETLAGRLPKNEDEVAISDFIFDMLKLSTTKFTLADGNTRVTVTDYDSVLWTEQKPTVIQLRTGLSDKEFQLKIVGIYKGETPSPKFDDLKKAAEGQGSPDYNLSYQWNDERPKGLFNYVAITQKLLDNNLNAFVSRQPVNKMTKYFKNAQALEYIFSLGNNEVQNYCYYMAPLSQNSKERLTVYGLDGNKITALQDNQVAIPYFAAIEILKEAIDYYVDTDTDYQEWYSNIVGAFEASYEQDNPRPQIEDFETNDAYSEAAAQWYDVYSQAYDAYWKTVNPFADMTYLEEAMYANYNDYDAEETRAKANKMFAELSARNVVLPKLNVTAKYNNESRDCEIVGVFYDKLSDYNELSMYFNDNLYELLFTSNYYNETITETNYTEAEDAIYSGILIAYDRSSTLTSSVVGLTFAEIVDDSFVFIDNPMATALVRLNQLVDELGSVFLYVGLVLAAFAFLLMFNFISVSIAAKKKEIGILRAIGARSLDVFKIFISEALIISAVCAVFSMLFTYIVCVVLNNVLVDTIIKAAVFVFGPLSALVIVAIALVTALVSTLIPVAIYCKKPPVHSIRAL